MKIITRMRDFFRKKTWIITAAMFILALGLSSAIVYFEFGLKQNISVTSASAGNNVTGHAWSPNIGWISFNCTNDSPACGSSNYGVSISLTTGYFSGYAWSSSAGWISFNRKTCVGGSDNGANCAANNDCTSNSCRLDGPGAAGAPPSAPYDSPASLNYNAIYDFNTGIITGWAKILSLGDNGWIKLRKYASDSGPDYGLSIDPITGNFSGMASHNNNQGSCIGWISFNCADPGCSCSASNYKVIADINRPPTAINLTAPNWTFSEAGQYGTRGANPSWTFNDPDIGSSESAYQIIVNTVNSSVNPVFDSGKCIGYGNPTSKCKIDPGVGQFPLISAMPLNYNTPYYWWVKTWDNKGAPSSLIQYNTSPDTDNNDNQALTFTTYRHEMPVVNFSWFPVEPSKGEKVKFTDASQVYLNASPGTPTACNNSICHYAWTATAGAQIDDPATSTPTMTFISAGNATVKLRVTDNEGYYIERQATINVNAKLPKWREVKPQ